MEILAGLSASPQTPRLGPPIPMEMKAALQPHDIRQLVEQVFIRLGAEPASLPDLSETLLVDQGRCAARSYALGSLMAMWLVEVGLVQFYDADGNMLETVSLHHRPEPRRRAA